MQTTNWRWYIIQAERFGETYYLKSTGSFSGKPYNSWTQIKDDAVTFSDLKTAQRIAEKIDFAEVIEQFVCPSCNGVLGSHPALSRKDNQTRICTKCGVREAMEAFEKGTK